MRKTLGIIGIFLLLLGLSSCRSLDMTRYKSLTLEATELNETSFSITFLGNTNLLLDDGTTTILTDGYFSRLGLFKSIFRAEPDIETLERYIDEFDLGSLDYIIPLHHHFDHVMDVPALSHLTNAEVLGTDNTLNVLKGWSAKMEPPTSPIFRHLNSGKAEDIFTEQLGEFNLTFIRSSHMQNDLAKGQIKTAISPPTFARSYKTGEVWIIIVTHDTLNGKILVVGSAGDVPSSIKNSVLLSNTDIVFIAVPGLAKKSKSEQIDFLHGFLTKTPPRLVVPIHWDDLFSYETDGSVFFKLKPQSAVTNTMAKTQKSIDLVCKTAAQNLNLDMAVFQFGISYAATVSMPSEINSICGTVQRQTIDN